MNGWGVGEIHEIHDLMRAGEVIATDVDPREVVFWPGQLIPLGCGCNNVQCTLEDVGDAVAALTWDWPAR